MHIAIKIIKNFIDYRKYYWVAIIKIDILYAHNKNNWCGIK